MTWPTIEVGAAFGADPFGSGYSFTDLSERTMQLSIVSPTRSRLIDTFSAGTSGLVLDNADRALDPTNLSGAYVSGGRSQIVPNLPLRIQATYSATTYPLSYTYRDSGKVTWADPSWSEVAWSGTDAFKLLGRAPVLPVDPAVGDAELSGLRVSRILDNAGWPAGLRSVADGLSRMQGTLHDKSPLAELQLVAASEGGEVWCAGDGNVTFKDRSYRTSTSSWTFSDATGSNDYTDVVLTDDEDLLINHASITRIGGLPQVSDDLTSQGRYGPSSSSQWQRTDLVMLEDVEADAIARMAVDVYADSVVRFSSMTLDPTVNDALWPFVLGMQHGDRVEITKTPPGGGSAITRTGFVEGWRHDVIPGNGGTQGIWQTQVVLSDAQGAWDRTFFVLDSSALDGSHVLIW